MKITLLRYIYVLLPAIACLLADLNIWENLDSGFSNAPYMYDERLSRNHPSIGRTKAYVHTKERRGFDKNTNDASP